MMITVKLEIHFQLKREGKTEEERVSVRRCIETPVLLNKKVQVPANYTVLHSGSNTNNRQVPNVSKK